MTDLHSKILDTRPTSPIFLVFLGAGTPPGADLPQSRLPRDQAPPRCRAPLENCCKACWDTTCKACWDTTPLRPAARHAGIPPAMHAGIAPSLWTESQMPVTTLPWPNFVAGGKNGVNQVFRKSKSIRLNFLLITVRAAR